MALCEIHFKSQVLMKQVGMYVILPEVGQPPYPAFYLLHGLGMTTPSGSGARGSSGMCGTCR